MLASACGTTPSGTSETPKNGGTLTWALDADNTNIINLKNSVLGPYTTGPVGLYKCPADKYLSAVQKNRGAAANRRLPQR